MVSRLLNRMRLSFEVSSLAINSKRISSKLDFYVHRITGILVGRQSLNELGIRHVFS